MRSFRMELLVLCLAGLASGCTFLHKLETKTHQGQTPAPKVVASAPPNLTAPAPILGEGWQMVPSPSEEGSPSPPGHTPSPLAGEG